MHPNLIEEFRRLRDNAGDKREKLLRIAYKQTRLRKRLNIAAGVLALLSAASITALLGDFTTARAMKILAALFSTASGLISLLVNTGYKESEISELNLGAAGYLNLRERAHRIPLNPNIDDVQAYSSLAELQDLYGDLDVKFQRYVVIERWAVAGGARETIVPMPGVSPGPSTPTSYDPPQFYFGSERPSRSAPGPSAPTSYDPPQFYFGSERPTRSAPPPYTLPMNYGTGPPTSDQRDPYSMEEEEPPSEE